MHVIIIAFQLNRRSAAQVGLAPSCFNPRLARISESHTGLFGEGGGGGQIAITLEHDHA